MLKSPTEENILILSLRLNRIYNINRLHFYLCEL